MSKSNASLPSSRRRRTPRLEGLEQRIVPAGLLDNVESNLAALYRLTRSEETLVGNVVQSADQFGRLFQGASEHPQVQIWTREQPDSVVARLGELGITTARVNNDYRLIEAGLSLDELPAVAALPGVLAVTPVYRAQSRAGGVMTQGDTILKSDLVRSLGFDGAPSSVGVISDSALNIAGSQATGDLPTPVDRYLEIPTFPAN